MRLSALLAATLLLLSANAALGQTVGCSQQSTVFPGNGAPVSCSPTYQGPGDIFSGASAWYGLRAYSAAAAAAGQKAINIRRTSDSTTSDIRVLSNGNLDVATATTFCNATTCFVVTAYDQSGNARDATQATTTAQPQLVFNCLGTRPCMTFVTASSQVLASSTANISALYSIASVAIRTANFTAFGGILADNAGNGLAFNNAASSIWEEQGVGAHVDNGVTDSAWHSIIAVFDAAVSSGSSITADGVLSTGTLAAATVGAGLMMGDDNTGFLGGSIGEAGFWPTIAMPAATMCHNQFVYWNTSVSC